jgi:hypothetical protein
LAITAVSEVTPAFIHGDPDSMEKYNGKYNEMYKCEDDVR